MSEQRLVGDLDEPLRSIVRLRAEPGSPSGGRNDCLHGWRYRGSPENACPSLPVRNEERPTAPPFEVDLARVSGVSLDVGNREVANGEDPGTPRTVRRLK